MKVGDKVVCIDDSMPPDWSIYFADWIKKDVIYSVRGLDLRSLPTIGIFVVGIYGDKAMSFHECSFKSARFRKVWSAPAFTEAVLTELI